MNIFHLPVKSSNEEIIDHIICGNNVRIERIISFGQSSAPGFWYDQDQDEWVVLLQGAAVLSWESGKTIELEAGDCLLLPAHERHRVEWTSQKPPCIWLAVHGDLNHNK